MKPEALAWTLLFVVAFALVYRFFAWVGRRFSARSAEPSVAAKATAASETAAAFPAPAKEAPSAMVPLAPTTVEDPVFAHPSLPAAALVPSPAPARDYRGAAPARDEGAIASSTPFVPITPAVPVTSVDAAPSVPNSLPRAEPVRPDPGPSRAVISARRASEAVRRALAPNVAATMPPPSPLKPSIAATLPPASVASPPELASVAHAVFPAAAVAVSAALAHAMALETTRKPEAPAADETPRPKTVRLRARRIGVEAVQLDIRLRDSRERRIQRTPEIARKSVKPAAIKALRVLGRKAPLERAPARRVGQTAGRPLALISIRKGAMKVVGASRPPSRVLSTTGA